MKNTLKIIILITYFFVFFYGVGVGLYKWVPYNEISWLKNKFLSRDELSSKKINLDIKIKTKNASELLILRRDVLNRIIPSKKIPVFSEIKDDKIIYSINYYGINVKSILSKTKTKTKCLIVYIQGHGGNPNLFGYHNSIKSKYTKDRCDFLSMSMIGLGLNLGKSSFPTYFGEYRLNLTQSKNHGLYQHFYDKNNTELDPLSLFLYPHIRIIEQSIDDHSYEDVNLMGISGGGWYVVWLAALMPQIKKSLSYAGSLPMEYRKFRSNEGDWEQTSSELYRIVSYFDLYQLMLINKDGLKLREAILVYNSNDDCCFMNPYATHFKNLINNKSNFPLVIIDDNNSHVIKPKLIYSIFK